MNSGGSTDAAADTDATHILSNLKQLCNPIWMIQNENDQRSLELTAPCKRTIAAVPHASP
jgi:hypothetical protein